MKFSVSKETLYKPLNKLSSIASRKSTHPIFTHVLIETSSTGMTLKATDTEVTLQIRIPAEAFSSLSTGAITTPVSMLVNLMRSWADDDVIHFAFDNEQLVVQRDKSISRLATLPAEDFPVAENPPAEQRFVVNSQKLHNSLRNVMFSIAKDDPRYFLKGICLAVVDDGYGLHAVSSDGHRLSCARCVLDEPAPVGTRIIIPKKGVEEILKLLSSVNQPVVLNFNERQLSICLDDYELTTQLIDGDFPDYQQILPIPMQENPILIARKPFLEALQRAKVLLVGKEEAVRLRFEGATLFLSSRNIANETLDDVLDIANSAQHNAEVALRVAYLVDAVSTLSAETIQLHFKDNSSAFLLTSEEEDDELRCIIMPMCR